MLAFIDERKQTKIFGLKTKLLITLTKRETDFTFELVIKAELYFIFNEILYKH